ncbi:MAG: cysteine--tRNA ligase [Bacteroidales bacterium]|nr:cysteine--tRNA ligase [Bacteroidales bacterium]
MMQDLIIYNTLSHNKELFKPITPGYVGMYVCGPTVYGDGHLGHARPAITFDVLFRYLRHIGYKVRYVRNITDVGHLEHDADDGEDKIAKKARLEQLEPMEVAQYYTNRYHAAMERLNVLPPSIEPHASGHILEQIELVQKIIAAGYAYESNGSVYFDLHKYADHFKSYGRLSGRVIDEMLSTTRELDGQTEKRDTADFALWKKAAPEHIMRWNSPWSVGFPGWHTECTAMGCKYLGETFDIHGGGMDLMFPHHESEIAQQTSVTGHGPCRYWMHNNMITINGQKMGKSLGNFITLDEFFNGSHKDKDGKEMLQQAYTPMTIRFFILTAHYRSTVDFSNEALIAAEKGYHRLMQAYRTLKSLTPSKSSSVDVRGYRQLCYDAMNDDLNTPIVIGHLFDAAKVINTVNDKKATLTQDDINELTEVFNTFLFDVMGLRDESSSDNEAVIEGLMNIVLDIRATAKANKDWGTSDKIRDALASVGIAVKDGKDGATWELKG